MKFSKGFLEELLKKEDFFSISISKYSITLLIYFYLFRDGKKENKEDFSVSASNILITLLIYFYLFRDGKKEDKEDISVSASNILITLLIYFYLFRDGKKEDKEDFPVSASRKPLENFILQGFFKKNFVLLKSFFKETSFFKSSSMKTLFFKSPSTKNFASTYLGGSGDCHLDSLIHSKNINRWLIVATIKYDIHQASLQGDPSGLI